MTDTCYNELAFNISFMDFILLSIISLGATISAPASAWLNATFAKVSILF